MERLPAKAIEKSAAVDTRRSYGIKDPYRVQRWTARREDLRTEGDGP